MPQGKRKVPFSGKAKKEQLKQKGQRKQGDGERSSKNFLLVSQEDEDNYRGKGSSNKISINVRPSSSAKNTNRYTLQFLRETDEEVRASKELARQTLQHLGGEQLEIYAGDAFPVSLDFPHRPKWSYEESTAALNTREHKYFSEYLANIERNFDMKELSYFELNLETWRQLWRVLEMSDIVLLIVDIRFAGLMFPPSLYTFVTKTLNKNMILVLNKIDLCESGLVVAWQHYFTTTYPGLRVICFTTIPGYMMLGKQQNKAGMQIRRRKGRARMAAEAAQQLFEVCKDIVQENVDLTSWASKITDELAQRGGELNDAETVVIPMKACSDYYEHERYKDGIVTIGCIGQPNVGKSSVMNALMGRKVVSVSKTPGHTKHFQTINLTDTVRLCDCPGLVFPSKAPKPIQVLMGSFPIAQTREPFGVIQYLAQRLDLPRILQLSNEAVDGDEWSAMDVCEAWAEKCGFKTARAGRPDLHRAANNLLRLALDGALCLNFYPAGYWSHRDEWSQHGDIEKIERIKAQVNAETGTNANEDEKSESSDADDSDSEDDDSEPSQNATNKFSVLRNE